MRVGTILKLGFVIAVLVAVALVAVVKSIDVDAYRAVLAQAAKAATGRDLVVHGRLSLKPSLTPAIVAEDVSFSNAAWGSRPDMVHVGRVEAAIGLIPLLAREIRIDRLLLVDPDILLEEDKGRANWRFDDAGAQAAEHESEEPIRTRLSIAEVRIEHGHLEWRPGAGGTPQTVDLQRLTLDTPSTIAPVGVAATGNWNGHAFDISGVLGPIGDLLAPPAAGLRPYTFKLKAVLPSLVAVVDGTVANTAAGRNTTVRVTADTPHMGEAGRLFDVELPSLGAGRLSFTLQGASDRLTVTDIDATVGRKDQLSLVAKGAVKDPLDGRGVDLAVGIEADSLASAGRGFGAILPAVGPLKVSARLSDDDDAWRLADIKGTLGHSDLTGKGRIVLGDERPKVRLALTSEAVDAAEWKTALAEPAKGAAPRRADGRVFSAEPLPWAALGAADVDFDWRIARLTAGALEAQDVVLPVTIRDRRLTVAPTLARIAGGQASAKLSADATTTPPRVALDVNGDKIALGPVLAGLGIADTVSGGKTDLRVRLAGAGLSPRAIMADLKGDTLLVTDRARIAKVRIDFLAVDLLSELMPGDKSPDTDLRCLVSRFSVAGGLAKSETLLLDTAHMTVVGQGSINLGTEGLDMQLAPKPKEASLISLAIPLDIGGTLASPSVVPDQGALAKGIVGAIGGLALGPLGALVPLVSAGTGSVNPCLAAIDQARHPQPRSKAAKGKGGAAASKAPLDRVLQDLFGN